MEKAVEERVAAALKPYLRMDDEGSDMRRTFGDKIRLETAQMIVYLVGDDTSVDSVKRALSKCFEGEIIEELLPVIHAAIVGKKVAQPQSTAHQGPSEAQGKQVAQDAR